LASSQIPGRWLIASVVGTVVCGERVGGFLLRLNKHPADDLPQLPDSQELIISYFPGI
jgi:hypothetical protein